MRIIKTLVIALALGSIMSNSQAQIKRDIRWNENEFNKANTAKDVAYLSENEKSVICLCNLARSNGKLFASTYLKDYAEKNSLNSEYVQSLYNDLENVNNLPMLIPNEELSEAAANHASDIGKNGKIGHNSSDGKDLSSRFEKYFEKGNIFENCSYGKSEPIEIVMQLLIDENVTNLGHRKSILSSQYSSVGVSIAEHILFDFNCVLDFYDSVL
ncbi:MAG: CAP domain-containing protein [Bacteroidales bacterium]|nr:CAP domain-containing protein [Bacteroidales bacterium]